MKSRNLGLAILAVAMVCMVGSDLLAQGQRGGQRGQRGGQQRGQSRQRGGGGFSFAGFGGSSRRDIALREDVSKALSLLDDQKEQITELRSGYSTARRQAFRDAGNDREKMRAALAKVSEEYDGKLDDILLPHQSKRLTQISNQYQIRMRRGGASGTAAFLGSDKPAKELKISDSQKEDLSKKAEEINKEMEKKVAKLREEAQLELLGVLSGAQRTQFKEMVGEPFTFESTRSRFGQRGGQRGGQQRGGGQRGQQRGGGQRTRPGADRKDLE